MNSNRFNGGEPHMPLKKGKGRASVQSNIHEMVLAGHDPKQAVAAALAHARKYADGGIVEEDEGIEGEERTLGEIQLEGMEHPSEVYNPSVEERNMKLARALREDRDSVEFMAEGGLVEAKDNTHAEFGSMPTESMASGEREDVHTPLTTEGVSEAAMDAIRQKRRMRRLG